MVCAIYTIIEVGCCASPLQPVMLSHYSHSAYTAYPRAAESPRYIHTYTYIHTWCQYTGYINAFVIAISNKKYDFTLEKYIEK